MANLTVRLRWRRGRCATFTRPAAACASDPPESPAVVITGSSCRYFLRQAVESSMPNLFFLAHSEIPKRGVKVISAAGDSVVVVLFTAVKETINDLMQTKTYFAEQRFGGDGRGAEASWGPRRCWSTSRPAPEEGAAVWAAGGHVCVGGGAMRKGLVGLAKHRRRALADSGRKRGESELDDIRLEMSALACRDGGRRVGQAEWRRSVCDTDSWGCG